MKFLIVDDSASMRRIIATSLHRIGFTDYVEAADGQEALRCFDASIGCVITDWNMPNMAGVELVRALRQHDNGAAVPIIMVTTRSVRDDLLEAARAGVNNYIIKPFTWQTLKEKLEHVLGAGAVR
jgi:two-component system chemotaxis response regulator CheY